MILYEIKQYTYITIVATVLALLISFSFDSASVSAYSASITTSNAISLDAVLTGDGTSIHSESINVQSDCRAGYNLTIATPQGSNLYANGDSTQSASFTAVDGTSALSSSNNTNKWGYTLTSNPTSATVFSPLSTTASVLKTSSETASPSSDIDDTLEINAASALAIALRTSSASARDKIAIPALGPTPCTLIKSSKIFLADSDKNPYNSAAITCGFLYREDEVIKVDKFSNSRREK